MHWVFFSEMYESREEFFLSFKYVFTKIVEDISLKIWANCANSDTSMKISDKHHDSISFTHGLLSIIFFSFCQDFFSYGIYFRMKYGLRNIVYCYKNNCKYNRDALFSKL